MEDKMCPVLSKVIVSQYFPGYEFVKETCKGKECACFVEEVTGDKIGYCGLIKN